MFSLKRRCTSRRWTCTSTQSWIDILYPFHLWDDSVAIHDFLLMDILILRNNCVHESCSDIFALHQLNKRCTQQRRASPCETVCIFSQRRSNSEHFRNSVGASQTDADFVATLSQNGSSRAPTQPGETLSSTYQGSNLPSQKRVETPRLKKQ